MKPGKPAERWQEVPHVNLRLVWSRSAETAVEVAIEQLEQLVPLLPPEVRVLADRWSATGPFVHACQCLQLDALMRLKCNRKLYRPAPPTTAGKRGVPRKDGALEQGSRPETWGELEACWVGEDERGKVIRVQAWQGLHFQQAWQVDVSVYRVLRAGARETKRDPRESWFVWIAPAPLAPWEVAGMYRRRFSHEHTSRFRHRRICSGPRCASAPLTSLSAGVRSWRAL